MAANNVHVPDDLLAQAERLAATQGRTAGDLVADALKRYLAHERLEALSRYGREKARELGIDSLSQEQTEELIERLIHEHRRES